MKLFALALVSLVSFSTFAQDKIDFILYRINAKGYTGEEGLEFQMAKVEMTRERYNRMLTENLMMVCRTTKDKNVDLVFYEKQISAMYKTKDGRKVGRCEGNGCFNEDFEDLSGEMNGASNGDTNIETSVTLDYYMGSIANYEAYKARRASWNWNLPASSEIPYVTMYDPAVHAKIPVNNSFYCALMNMNNQAVSP